MRLIGIIEDESRAKQFGDYLLTQGMASLVEKSMGSDRYQIWVEHDDHVEAAGAMLERFRLAPDAAEFASPHSEAARIRAEQRKNQAKRAARIVDVRTHQAELSRRGAPLTTMLVMLCVLVGLSTGLGYGEEPFQLRVIDALLFQPPDAAQVNTGEQAMRAATEASPGEVETGPRGLGVMFSSVMGGEIWRLVTPMLIHFGIVHLLFNMYWLVQLGGRIERLRGVGYMLVLVLVSAVVSNVGQAIWTAVGPWGGSGYSMFGGMSGVVYALFGYVWVMGKRRPIEGLGLDVSTIWAMMTWLILAGLFLDFVANAAHVMGLLTGVVWARCRT